jgi:hypothetical protein
MHEVEKISVDGAGFCSSKRPTVNVDTPLPLYLCAAAKPVWSKS